MDSPPKKKRRSRLERYTYDSRPLDSTGFEPIAILITLPRRMWEKVDEVRGETGRSKWFAEIIKKTR